MIAGGIDRAADERPRFEREPVVVLLDAGADRAEARRPATRSDRFP